MIANYQVERQQFPYMEAKNYFDFNSIVEAFPHLSKINPGDINWAEKKNVQGIIIRSANDDNVHKAIKYGIWTTTPKNRTKLQEAFLKNTEIFLFFSVVKSGMFEGVARLISGMNEDTFPFWWDDHALKFKCFFQIEWVYIKDVNYKHFSGLVNLEGEDVTKSKDCDELDMETTVTMLETFRKKPMKNKWIFNDFQYMDKRQKNYTRPLQMQRMMPNQDYRNYPYYNGYNYNYYDPQQQQMMLPPQMMKPITKQVQPRDLGFQMNPLSKNRKK